MMEGFADLLTDAFSETSVPSIPDGDLDFESLNLDEKCDEDENLAETDGALLQEAADETAVLFGKEAEDASYSAENEVCEDDKSDEEDFAGVRTPEEHCTSSDGDSEQEDSVSGEDEDNEEEEEEGTVEEPGDLLMSVHCDDELHDGDKEDRIFAEGQPLAPEAAENPQVRNEEQGEAESDEEEEDEEEEEEEEAYFGKLPEDGSEMTIKGVGAEEDEQEKVEEKQEDSSDPEWEGMKIEQEENAQEVESPYGDEPAKAGSEFPSISLQNLQDLIAEVDSEESVEKMKDFSGEEHQEAGESFADYPSDFSSCEYAEDGGKSQESKKNASLCASECDSDARQQDMSLERDAADLTCDEDADRKEDDDLYGRDLEMEADRLMSLGGQETERFLGNDDGEDADWSGSYSSSDEEFQPRRNNEELLDNMCLQEPEKSNPNVGSSTEDHHNTKAEPADYLSWEFDVLKTDDLLSEYLFEDPEKAGTPYEDANRRPEEDDNCYSVVQREDSRTTSSSYQGSLDDDFFFNAGLEASGATELGALGEDEYEEERNWEQEQERIKAFYKFYDDSDEENGKEGRQIKVQFCADPLSRVIHYETDSDRDSLSSSSDREENPSSAETSDEPKEPEDILQRRPACDPPNVQLTETIPDISTTQTCTGKHKCLSPLKLMLKMGLVTATGLLMFWLTTDQADWIREIFFF
ncbi:ABC transporter F family member 4 isoform X3 [Amphiprion ocellaris]|uniref:ABC transporter F family member 4 isoform X3 n=1 Tax=Amphiprion ocellaris TaxID=80972 RepID=UPI0024113AB9|nr:ABC transporter F family member 4 isoform X3 [Amphiprion ocellaris]